MSALCLLGPGDEPLTGGQWPADPFRNTAAVSARLGPSAAQPALVKVDGDTHSHTHWVSSVPQGSAASPPNKELESCVINMRRCDLGCRLQDSGWAPLPSDGDGG